MRAIALALIEVTATNAKQGYSILTSSIASKGASDMFSGNMQKLQLVFRCPLRIYIPYFSTQDGTGRDVPPLSHPVPGFSNDHGKQCQRTNLNHTTDSRFPICLGRRLYSLPD